MKCKTYSKAQTVSWMLNLCMSHWNQRNIKRILFILIGKVLTGIRRLNNRHIANMLKQTIAEKLEEGNNGDLTRDWLVIKEFSKSRDEGGLKEIWFQSNKQLLDKYWTDAVIEDFESWFNLEENKIKCDRGISSILYAASDRQREI